MPAVLTALPSTQSELQASITPWWGAWSAILIVGCFYLTQTTGIFMVQMVAALNVGLSKGVEGLADLEQTWLLPLSLFLSTIGAAMLSWKVAMSRAKPCMTVDWFCELLGKSYDILSLWRFVFLGLSLGLGFFVLTEYGVLPPDDLPQPLFDAMLAAPLLLKIGWVLMFVVLFPMVEETLFRGFLFTGLSQSWGLAIGGVVTTVIFIAVHMPKVLEYWPALFAVTLIGSVTVLLRFRTGSLASPPAQPNPNGDHSPPPAVGQSPQRRDRKEREKAPDRHRTGETRQAGATGRGGRDRPRADRDHG